MEMMKAERAGLRERIGGGAIGVLLAASLLALAAAAVWVGPLNQDEGWYLNAALNVARGEAPYADFAFTQGPVLPGIYGLVAPLWSPFGVLGGRMTTLLFGLAGSAVLVGLLARRAPVGDRPAAWAVGGALALLNLYQLYFLSVVKTYSLTLLWIALGLAALDGAAEKRSIARAAAGGLFLALAAGTRLSAGILLAVGGAWLVGRALRRGGGHALWIAFGAGGALGLVALYGRFFVLAPEGLRFGLLEYHGGRAAGVGVRLWVNKVGFALRVAGAWLPALAAACLALSSRPARSGDPRDRRSDLPLLLLSCAAALTAVHVVAPFPYDDYQVIAYPLFALWAAGLWIERHGPSRGGSTASCAAPILGLCLLAAAASPLIQEWAVAGRDRIWWHLKERTDLQTLRAVGRLLRERGAEGETLLTQDAYLAVEANALLPGGLEMGPFSYFPEMTTERARALHVVNRALLEQMIRESKAPWAAVSGYGFAIEAPAIAPVPPAERQTWIELLERRYHPVERFHPFGQAGTELVLYRRRPPEAARVDGTDGP
jgi:hypothetical protein